MSPQSTDLPERPALALAGDHNGVILKAGLVDWLVGHGYRVDDRGVFDPDVVVDYPALCLDLCGQVLSGRARFGVFVGGTGQGEVIACNKVRGIRAGVCHSVLTAEVSRGNNDANVLILGAKTTTLELACEIMVTWLATPFKGGRHALRVAQIAQIEATGGVRAEGTATHAPEA